MNNPITEMNDILEGINSRITEAEEQISELEDRMMEINAKEQLKENRIRCVKSQRPLGNNKSISIWSIGVLEEGEKRKGSEKIFENIIVKKRP